MKMETISQKKRSVKNQKRKKRKKIQKQSIHMASSFLLGGTVIQNPSEAKAINARYYHIALRRRKVVPPWRKRKQRRRRVAHRPRRRPVPRDPNSFSFHPSMATSLFSFTDTDSTSAAALIIGSEYVSYAKRKQMERLPGCHRDAFDMRTILHNKYSVPNENMILLMDDNQHASPTRTNIITALEFLLSKNIETIYFTYSGHGSYSTSGIGISTEPDRRNETIVPSDFLTAGMIVDNTLNTILCNQLKSTTKHFVSIFDSCFSGTILDLPYEFSVRNPSNRIVGDRKEVVLSSSPDCTIISLSACLDSQTANSAFNLGNSRTWQGALTYAFCNYSNSRGGSSSFVDGSTLIRGIQSILDRNGYSIQTTVISTNRTVTSAAEIYFPFFVSS
jgi:hypothetical protein